MSNIEIKTIYQSRYINPNLVVPSGYTQLEYIQSDGAAIIDTNIIPTLDYTVEVKAIKRVNFSLFGSSAQRFTFTGLNDLNYAYIGSNSSLPVRCGNLSIPHIWKITNRTAYCDTNASSLSSGTTPPTLSLALFGRKVGDDSYNDKSDHTIYYAKIWNENNALVFNGIPAKRNSDNVLGMYDIVSNTFFTNVSLGNFIAGPIVYPLVIKQKRYYLNTGGAVIPNEYQEVEWIQSTASSYIKTNYTGHDEYLIDCKMENVASAKSSYWFGQTQAHDYMMYNGFYNLNALEYNWKTISLTGAAAQALKEMYQVKDGANCIITINGVSWTKEIGNNDSTGNFIICGCNSVRTYGAPLKIYWFKMHDGDTMIMDLIPCYRKSDTAIGLYDIINEVFYPGTGTFTKGNDRGVIKTINQRKYYIGG